MTRGGGVYNVIWKRRMLVLLVLLGACVSSLVVGLARPSHYESTAVVALTPDVTHGTGFVSSDSLFALLGTYAESAKAKANLRRASAILHRPLPGEVETSTEEGTGIVTIVGRSTSRQGAVDTARATAQAFRASIADNRLLVPDLIDPATMPTTPVQPRPALITVIAILIALLAGSAFTLAVDRVRRRIETTADVAEITDVPVIGELPSERALSRELVRTVWDDDKLVALQESYRSLRINVGLLAQQEQGSVLQVTSADAGQGKSTVVANLGIALARVGVETLIVDADLRRPRQHSIFELDNSEGLSTRLVLPGSGVTAIPTAEPDLSVLPSGPIPPDPTEVLHIRFKHTLDELRGEGVTVLVDSPPLLPVTDARLIASHVDGVILVVAAGTSNPVSVRAAIEMLEAAGDKLVGIIINRSGEESDDSGAYSYYEYGETAPPVGAGVS
jgi:succinoglycan biosynthesis transport protein ExoP